MRMYDCVRTAPAGKRCTVGEKRSLDVRAHLHVGKEIIGLLKKKK